MRTSPFGPASSGYGTTLFAAAVRWGGGLVAEKRGAVGRVCRRRRLAGLAVGDVARHLGRRARGHCRSTDRLIRTAAQAEEDLALHVAPRVPADHAAQKAERRRV